MKLSSTDDSVIGRVQSARAMRPRSRLPTWFGGIRRPAALEVEVGVAVEVSVVSMRLAVVVEVDVVVMCVFVEVDTI